MTTQRPILKYFKDDILSGNSLIVKSGCGQYRLSLPNEENRTGELHIDTGIWFASDLQLPKNSNVKWQITDEYLLFYKIEDKQNISTHSVKIN